jgi:uncharacterized membrane protein
MDGMTPRTSRLIPAGLIALTLIPAAGGAVRLGSLASGGPVTPGNERFFAMPVPVVLHIVAALIYCVLGAFQFAPRFRRRRPRWHRTAGWVLVPAGLTVALTGVWMTLAYEFPAVDGTAVKIERLIVGGVLAAAIVLAIRAVRRRDFAGHRAWMIRAYALAQGAGTQAFTQVPWMLLAGELDATGRAVALGGGWLINALIAEWIIRRKKRPARVPARPRYEVATS